MTVTRHALYVDQFQGQFCFPIPTGMDLILENRILQGSGTLLPMYGADLFLDNWLWWPPPAVVPETRVTVLLP